MSLNRYRRRLREAGWHQHAPGSSWWIPPEHWSEECRCPIGQPRLWILIDAINEQNVREMAERNGFDVAAHRRREALKRAYGA